MNREQRSLLHRFETAEARRAAALATFEQADAELTAARRTKRGAEDRARERERTVAELAWRRLRGDVPCVPVELATLVDEAVPRIRSDQERRSQNERGRLAEIYSPLAQYEQSDEPARRRVFADLDCE